MMSDYLVVGEVAQRLRLSKMTVYRLINDGELPAVRFGRGFRISESSVLSYIARCETTPEPEAALQ